MKPPESPLRSPTSSSDDAASAELRQWLAPPPAAIAGHRVVRELGRGAMGIVFEAEQPLTRRRVALKVVLAAIDGAGRRRFERECEALARLDHPGIARLWSAGSTERGEPWLAMELIEGETLAQRLRDAAWPRAERLRCFVSLAEAVGAAHAAGIVHRDVKPANVLIDRDGAARVVDFGLALLQSGVDPTRVTRAGGAVGTLAYASPEQLRGGDVDARGDVWSLGVMLHELLTGRPPFPEGSDFATLVDAIVRRPPPRPSRAARDVAPELDAIVLKALERDRARRYGDAAALAADVRRFLAGERPLAPRIGGAREVARFAARHARAAGVAVGVVAAALALALVLDAARGGRRGAMPPDLRAPLEGRGFERIAPYAALRWRDGRPFVRHGGAWQELVALDGFRVELLFAFCRQTAPRDATRRFTEDFGEVLARVSGRVPPDRVTLRLRDAAGVERDVGDVPMTEVNRNSLWWQRHARRFDEVRERDGRVEVLRGGAWLELVAIAGRDVAQLHADPGFAPGKLALALDDELVPYVERIVGGPVPWPLEVRLRDRDGRDIVVGDLLADDVAPDDPDRERP